jgi:peptidoglycan/LPS O-acetylase OafA/YrhL
MQAVPDRPFRPDVEGLRAVAVLAVVLFHAAVPGTAGGFAGVDVFFVISGFLITGLLWREAGSGGRLRFARFYGARARRLLPAAVVVLVATAAVATAVLPPLRVRGVLGDAVASALYVGNYRLAVQGTDYLAASSPPSPFQHYWSLGVEEQFYLFWPALLVLAAWVGRRLLRHRPAAAPAAAPAVVLAAVAGASFAVSLVWTATSSPWAYFSLPSRAFELAVGGLVALGTPLWRHLAGPVAAVGGWAGLTLVVGSCVLLSARTPFPGTAALAPVLGAALVVVAGCAAPRGGAGVLLGLPPLRWIGRLSYSWYLWHWPVLVLAPPLLGHRLGLPAWLAAAAVSAALALATLHLVENPLRFAAPLRRSPRRSLVLGGALTAAGVCAALLAGVLAPGTTGRGQAVATPHVRPPAAPATRSPAESPAEEQVRALAAQVQAVVRASAGLQAVPSDLIPPLSRAGSDTAQPFHDGCDQGFTTATQPPCVFGDPAGSTTVALVGDSHAAAWYPAVEPVAEQRQERLDVLAKATCPFCWTCRRTAHTSAGASPSASSGGRRCWPGCGPTARPSSSSRCRGATAPTSGSRRTTRRGWPRSAARSARCGRSVRRCWSWSRCRTRTPGCPRACPPTSTRRAPAHRPARPGWTSRASPPRRPRSSRPAAATRTSPTCSARPRSAPSSSATRWSTGTTTTSPSSSRRCSPR